MQNVDKEKSNKTITCDECKQEFSIKQVRIDHVRFYKVRSGKNLCECCYDDYTDKMENYR